MTEYRAKTSAIRDVIANQLDLAVVWINSDAPRPNRPYATVQLLNSSRLHHAALSGVDDEGKAELLALREITASVQIYERADEYDPRVAVERAERLRDDLEKPSVRAKLRSEGWVFRDTEMLTDNPVQRGESWEPRATFDARFGTTVRMTDDLGIIEQVSVAGTVESEGSRDERTVEFDNIEEG